MTDKYFELNNGSYLPAVGFGTVKIQGAQGITVVENAIHNGYRLIDTSTNYQNEGMVGQAIKRSGIARSDIQITSKLRGAAHEYDKAIIAIQESLYRLDIDYFDNFIIHWPLPKQDKYVEAWQALVDAQKFGLIKNIGVSNFLDEHLDRIIEETEVTPQLNQIERHPFFNNKELVKANQDRGILVQAWSPIGRDIIAITENETLVQLAKKYAKTPAQIVLRWNLQNGVMPVVKSNSATHQKENLALFDFELTAEDLAQIDALDQGEPGRIEGQHPNTYEEFD